MNKARELSKRGYLRIQKHPTVEFFILHYTKRTVVEGEWNEITSISRGLIVDPLGNVIAKPFKKFIDFNLPNKGVNDSEYWEKLDGSLGILYWVNNIPVISTKGSFYSYQALLGNNLLHKKYSHIFENLDKENTYLFEIISPDNRVIVDYQGENDLFLLSVYNNISGNEIDSASIELPFPRPRRFDKTVISNINEFNSQKIEGIIVKNGYNYFRCKTRWYMDKYKEIAKYRNIVFDGICNKQTLSFLIKSFEIHDLEHFTWLYNKATSLYEYVVSIVTNDPYSYANLNPLEEIIKRKFEGWFKKQQFYSKEILTNYLVNDYE